MNGLETLLSMLDEFRDITRTVNLKTDEYDVLIARPSKWGNPYTHIKDRNTLAKHVVKSREEAIQSYRKWILDQPELLRSLHELKGKRLGCFCKKSPCHGDVLVELINLKTQFRITETTSLIKLYRQIYLSDDSNGKSGNSSTQQSYPVLP